MNDTGRSELEVVEAVEMDLARDTESKGSVTVMPWRTRSYVPRTTWKKGIEFVTASLESKVEVDVRIVESAITLAEALPLFRLPVIIVYICGLVGAGAGASLMFCQSRNF